MRPRGVDVREDPKRVLFLIENLPVPTDRRVWPECLSLRRAGYEVTVVCPQGTVVDQAPHEVIEGIEIYRFPLTQSAHGQLAYLFEYAQALWRTWRTVRFLARKKRFDVVHAGNPPDILLLAARSLKRSGTKFILDHHDLVPELYLSRFSRRRSALYWLTRATERLSFALADVVIATNESYRRVAIERGGKRAEDAFVVRNDPNLSVIKPVPPDPRLRRGSKHLIAYVGLMAPQDGIDEALHALARLREWRQDWHAVLVGGGDVLPSMRRLACELELEAVVEFPGVLPTEDVLRVLSTADVCIAPEPKTPLNDASTMIKIAEYMAIGRPIVSYDLTESRFTAGAAALYANSNDHMSFALCISQLLDDPELRLAMGTIGRARVRAGLSWADSERSLLAAYEHVLALNAPERVASAYGAGCAT